MFLCNMSLGTLTGYWLVSIMAGFELMYHNSGNTIHFNFSGHSFSFPVRKSRHQNIIEKRK